MTKKKSALSVPCPLAEATAKNVKDHDTEGSGAPCLYATYAVIMVIALAWSDFCGERGCWNNVRSLFWPTPGNRGDGTANDLACLMWTFRAWGHIHTIWDWSTALYPHCTKWTIQPLSNTAISENIWACLFSHEIKRRQALWTSRYIFQYRILQNNSCPCIKLQRRACMVVDPLRNP